MSGLIGESACLVGPTADTSLPDLITTIDFADGCICDEHAQLASAEMIICSRQNLQVQGMVLTDTAR